MSVRTDVSASLLCIGDNVVDLYQDRGEFFPGGNALNVAVLAKRCGLSRVGYIGLIGQDAEGAHVRKCLGSENIWIERLREAVGPTGKAIVALKDGDRVFVSSNKGGIQRALTLRMDVDDEIAIRSYENVHSSCYSYIEHELPKIRANAKTISYDFSTHTETEYIERVAPYITSAFFSGSHLTEAQLGALAETVLSYGVETVGITRGAQGAVWFTEGRSFEQAVKPVEVVDTLGAGDSFLAAYLSKRLCGASVVNALEFAAARASDTCTHFGAFGYAQPAMP